MPSQSLASDIIGRVARLSIRPNEKGALLPLMEAISNSVFSVTQRLGDATKSDGKILVRILRDSSNEDRVVGFEVEDNGVGFTSENFKSFLTPDSMLKAQDGGKGVGRLGWLKVFRSIHVESAFFEEGAYYKRSFDFELKPEKQVSDDTVESSSEGVFRTLIRFENPASEYIGKTPQKSETIQKRIISHFIHVFLGGNAPKFVIQDGSSLENIEDQLSNNIEAEDTSVFKLSIDGAEREFKVWSIKLRKEVKFQTGGYNFSFITGNHRSVIDHCIDDQLGLKLLDDQFVYVACTSSPFLDQNTSAERTSFLLDVSEIDSIKSEIAKVAREFLRSYVEAALTEKVVAAADVISENPQFIYLLQDLRGFAEGLQANAYKKEEIFVEMSRDRFRRQKKFLRLESEIKSISEIDDALREKIEEYKDYVADEQKGALAEYVVRRKAVIDIFEKFLEKQPKFDSNGNLISEKYSKEDVIHQLICPMKIVGANLEMPDHNLWLLDDRLAFSNFFASDLPISKYTSAEAGIRPDLNFFYDSCVAWRESANTNTVVLVEFKRPMRNNYSDGDDPVQQVLKYVEELLDEKAVDMKGRPLMGINKSTNFHCYIVADITPKLRDQMRGRFEITPDGHGYFGYSRNPTAWIEVVPYGKVMSNARMRNAIFFQKLGLSTAGS